MNNERRQRRGTRPATAPQSAWQNPWLRVAVVFALLVAVGAAALQFFAAAPTPPSASSVSSNLSTANCSAVQSQPNLGQLHMAAGDPQSSYQDTPPTSGPHDLSPLNDGVRSAPMTSFDIARAIHSLEHGRIVIYYNNLEAGQVAKLESVVKSNGAKIISAPWADLSAKV